MVLDPYFQQIVEEKADEIVASDHECEFYATPLKSEKMLKKAYREDLVKFFKLSDVQQSLENAEKIILTQMSNFIPPEKFEKIKHEINQSGEHFVQFINSLSHEKVKNSENPILLQQVFGLCNDTLLQIYSFAADLVKRECFNEAIYIFAFLATLAPHVSSYWIGQGACLQALDRHEEALAAFSVARAIKADNPAPIIYSIESYLAINDKENAVNEAQLVKKIAWTFETEEKNYWLKKINQFQLI